MVKEDGYIVVISEWAGENDEGKIDVLADGKEAGQIQYQIHI